MGRPTLVVRDTLPAGSADADALLARLRRLESSPIPVLPLSLPVSTLNTPSAFGASSRSAGIGVTYQHRTRYTRRPDAAIGFGLGLGDPVRAVGVSLGVSILDLRPNREGVGGFGRRGSFSLKLHRSLPGAAAVAVGVENSLNWGGSDAPQSVYGVLSKRVRLRPRSDQAFSRLYLSAGVGNGRYLPESDIFKRGLRGNLFASGALQVTDRGAALVEWTGQNLSVGASVAPIPSQSVVLSAGMTDLLHGAGSGPRLMVGAGWGFRI